MCPEFGGGIVGSIHNIQLVHTKVSCVNYIREYVLRTPKMQLIFTSNITLAITACYDLKHGIEVLILLSLNGNDI